MTRPPAATRRGPRDEQLEQMTKTSIISLLLLLLCYHECSYGEHDETKSRKSDRSLLFAPSCEEGKFYSSITNSCSDCPKFSSSPIASTNVRNCSCIVGYTGTFNISGSLNCAACAPGKYQTGTGMISDANCSSCSSGTYASTFGASLCLSCFQGSFQSGTGSSICSFCQKGFYQSASRSVKCTTCASGSYQSAFGASFCTSCPKGSTSSAGSSSFLNCTCGVGFSGLASSVSVICYGCAAGKYKEIIGTSVCIDCPASSTSPPSSTSVANCSCNPGYFQSASNVCSPCVPGTFSSVYGSTSCSACANLSWSGYASVSCACNSGYIAVPAGGPCAGCIAGTYKVSETACTLCPAGTFRSIQMISTSNCQPCRPGPPELVCTA